MKTRFFSKNYYTGWASNKVRVLSYWLFLLKEIFAINLKLYLETYDCQFFLIRFISIIILKILTGSGHIIESISLTGVHTYLMSNFNYLRFCRKVFSVQPDLIFPMEFQTFKSFNKTKAKNWKLQILARPTTNVYLHSLRNKAVSGSHVLEGECSKLNQLLFLQDINETCKLEYLLSHLRLCAMVSV